MCHMSRYCDYCEVADNCESSLSPRAQNTVHGVALSTGLWLKVCISMPRKHDDRGIPRRQVHEVPQSIASRWNRYLARDPPSYDSGIPIPPSYWHRLSEADAKTLMDKIEARSKWLKANGKAPKSLGKHQRVILARAKSKADVTMDATTHKPSDVDGHRP